LGGVRDESEIRGHRKTYVGAMPGKIISVLKKAGTSNPVILFDEIDKMSSDFRGDPASAMLEVLDPEQNKNFVDHYLEVDYDLSKVMFIMTANELSRIPIPLKDRMEIIQIPGYTANEKLQIAKNYLIQKAVLNNGLKDYFLEVPDSSMMDIIRFYSKEAGVRELERLLHTIARKVAMEVVEKRPAAGTKYLIEPENVKTYLGAKKFDPTNIEKSPQIGLVNGLAWTSVGGELLTIEVVVMPGTGKTQITGKLGEVMQESAKASISYVRSISDKLGISLDWFEKNDIHIHVPEGATPKDGPSAGVSMVTALTSAVVNIPVRQDVAMTGEVTIRGRVLPIGGLKEKMLAAKQAGIKRIIIPFGNEKDLEEIPNDIKDGLEICSFEHVNEVLKSALSLENPQTFLKMVGLEIVREEETTNVAN
jgi:ATP-dependent Lon protease